MAVSKDKSHYIDPDLTAGLEMMRTLTGDNDLTQDLAAARLAANARDDMLLSSIDLPTHILQGMETATASAGHDIEMRIMQPDGAGKKPLFKSPIICSLLKFPITLEMLNRLSRIRQQRHIRSLRSKKGLKSVLRRERCGFQSVWKILKI